MESVSSTSAHTSNLTPKTRVKAEQPTVTPVQLITYSPGAILVNSWGYEQTNIDFYCIQNRSGDFITLVPMTSVIVEQGDMRGKSIPGNIMVNAKPLRRKIKKSSDKLMEIGTKIKKYGWCDLWNGKPCSFTQYA